LAAVVEAMIVVT